jgi:hypothetical protein
MHGTEGELIVATRRFGVGGVDIISGIAAAKQALDIAKALKGIEKSYDEATLKAQLADLVSALADAKMSMVDAKEELALKDKEIAELKANFEQRLNLVQGDGDYKYFPSDEGQPVGFPICPTCEIDGKIVQLKQNGGPTQTRCPKCKSEFEPVSCFIAGGDGTLHAKEKRLKAEAQARSIEALNRINGRRVF